MAATTIPMSPPSSNPKPTTTRVVAAGGTDPGRKRPRNEDQFAVVQLQRSLRVACSSIPDLSAIATHREHGTLLVVADGMGGHRSGDVASSLAAQSAIQYLCENLASFDDVSSPDPPSQRGGHGDSLHGVRDELSGAVQHSDRRVKGAAREQGGSRRMGTTLTLAYLRAPRLYLAHVGDSRAYLLRDGELHCLTRDHTVAEEMAAQFPDGEIDADSRWHHVLTRALGASDEREARPDVVRRDLRVGDAVLLCSDGLTNHVDDDELCRVLRRSDVSCHETVRELIRRANDAGGRDNITVVVARYVEVMG